jgi:DNA polymerase III subunit alpha
MRLMSAVYLDNPAETSVTIEDLERCSEGLILLTGGAEGPLGRLIQRGDKDGAAALLDRLEPAFRGRLYVELQRHGEEAEALTEPASSTSPSTAACRWSPPMTASSSIPPCTRRTMR